ncbi:hypothetical protein FWH30_02375 [Microgenomates group bacterium]|nr:hypothetical protein [Microgenomates group bacterium]
MIKQGLTFSFLMTGVLLLGAGGAQALSLTIATSDYDQALNSVNDHVMINGTVSLDTPEQAVISATVGGKSKSTTIDATSTPSLNGLSWYLDWSGLELNYGVSGGVDEPIVVTVTTSSDSTTANYTGTITYGVANLSGDTVAMLDYMTQLLQVRFAGAIFVPEGTEAGVAGVTQDYTYHRTLDAKHEVWTKSIASKNYPFLVEFFPLPESGVLDGHYNSVY